MVKSVMVLLLSSLLFFTGCSSRTKPSSLEPTLQSHISNPSPKLYVSAWFAPFDITRGLQSFTEHTNDLNEINPVWYNLNSSYNQPGVETFTTNLFHKGPIETLARTNGVKLVPTIQNWGTTNFDPKVISRIINNPVDRYEHVREILELVIENEYDGIDIDYEALRSSAREDFSAFIAELAKALHERDKLLSVAVYAKTYDAPWNGAGAQDWAELAKHADALKVMGYDYHWCTYHPGPLAPLDWLEEVLAYAREVAGKTPELKRKLIIGLPLYGLDWEAWETAANPGPPAKEVMYEKALALREKATSAVKRDDARHPPCQAYSCPHSDNVEPYFIYYDQAGRKHIVYYQDAAATRARLELIDKYRHLIKGITFWRLGGEDPEIWREIATYSSRTRRVTE